jgi:23S rRNA (guanosine2251-2'-O)-methyltransferase
MDHWIHGVNAVLEALRADPAKLARVVLAAGRSDARVREVQQAARQAGVPVTSQPAVAVDRLAGPGVSHQGVVALLQELSWADPDAALAQAPSPALLVVLDGVDDPRNLGAVIRAAAAAGAGAVFVPEHRSAGLSPACIKASAGAVFRIPVARIGNVAAFLRTLKERGVWIAGLDPEGAPLWGGFDLREPVALVLGGEGKGLRRLTREHCDVLLALPLAHGVESLNLAVAAGVALYETVRQRHQKVLHPKEIV